MKIEQLRNMTDEELNVQIKDLKEELFNLRFQHATAQLGNPLRIRFIKRNLAQVKTIIRERELQELRS